MKVAVTFRPVFHLPLGEPEVRLLQELALNHYDWTCKGAGRVGGFIFGWVNRIVRTERADDSAMTVPASWEEIDISLKVLEMRRSMLPGRADDLARADTLNRDLRACLDRWAYIKPAETTFDTESRHG